MACRVKGALGRRPLVMAAALFAALAPLNRSGLAALGPSASCRGPPRLRRYAGACLPPATRSIPLEDELVQAVGLVPGEISTARAKGQEQKLVLRYVIRHSFPEGSTVNNIRVGAADGGKLKDTDVLPDVGVHRFTWRNETLHASVQELGESPRTEFEVVVIAAGIGRANFLKEFFDELLHAEQEERQNSFEIYRFNTGSGGLLGSLQDEWESVAQVPARSMSSVVLPAQMKSELLDDLDNFLNASTKKFFNKHGVPYRCGYLFHGSPGSGKTSLIQALAGKYHRNLCLLQLTGPKWGDMELQRAIDMVPGSSFVVVEDVDSLFGIDRSNRAGSGVTFAGFLKAMEGAMSDSDIVFILTTNHRERLDEALLRPGRIDKQLKFGPIDAEGIQEMFCQFYPDNADVAPAFLDALGVALPAEYLKSLSAAQLQNYFIRTRRSSAQEALEGVALLRKELSDRDISSDPFGFSPLTDEAAELSAQQALEQISALRTALGAAELD